MKRKTLCYAISNSSCFTWRKIKTDVKRKKKIYTGIHTIEMFNVIFFLIKPYLPNIVCWAATAKHRVTSTKLKKHSVTKSSRNLTQRDEFFLTFM